ncbi:hypothetical protein ACFX1T_002619 [Malus domestica]
MASPMAAVAADLFAFWAANPWSGSETINTKMQHEFDESCNGYKNSCEPPTEGSRPRKLLINVRALCSWEREKKGIKRPCEKYY